MNFSLKYVAYRFVEIYIQRYFFFSSYFFSLVFHEQVSVQPFKEIPAGGFQPRRKVSRLDREGKEIAGFS